VQAVDEGDSILNVVEYLETHTDQGVPGVYAIYDSHRAPQLISFSEDMFIQIKVCFKTDALCTTLVLPLLGAHVGTYCTTLCLLNPMQFLDPCTISPFGVSLA
jgi:hypothetical protein